MSRETLLDEAIAKAKEVGDWQLVDWLRMVRGGESAIRWYTEKLRELEDENAKMLGLCQDMLKTMQTMDEEWHSLADFTTIAEAAETYDFNAENAPEYEEKLREMRIGAAK